MYDKSKYDFIGRSGYKDRLFLRKKKMTEKSVCGIMKIRIHSMKADQEWKVVSVLWHIRIKNIFESEELLEESTCANFAQFADNGKTYDKGGFLYMVDENGNICLLIKFTSYYDYEKEMWLPSMMNLPGGIFG